MLSDGDLPEIYRTADASSTAAQRKMLNGTRVQLVLVVIGAGFSTVTWMVGDTEIGALAAGFAFAIAAVFRTSIAASKPERTWYDARAVAESAKTLGWRYAVGGAPFNVGLSHRETDRALIERLRALPEQLKDLQVGPPSDSGTQITTAMRALREASLDDRKAAYSVDRVLNQQQWYAGKARWNRRRANLWNRFLIFAEVVAASASVLKGTTDINIDILPVAGAIVAGATAWLQMKQHESLATAYTLASSELRSIADLLQGVEKEEEWATFIDEAEGAISREHTMWRAARSRPKTAPQKSSEGNA